MRPQKVPNGVAVLSREHRARRVDEAPAPAHKRRGLSEYLLLQSTVLVDPRVRQPPPKLKGSVGEGPNQTNYSDRSSVRIL